MSCSSCSSDKGLIPNGCKSNGNCATETCGSGNKLNVFNWLSNLSLPSNEVSHDIFEVRFKNGRKHFYKNPKNINVLMGDVVVLECSIGYDIGIVSLSGELVKVQMRKKNITSDNEQVKNIIRKATQKDIKIWELAKSKELYTQRRGREIIIRLGLKMKLSDVEYQGDNKKAIFYYTANSRVDYRQLIRDLANAFSVRIEMRQVGLRHEAARIGGIGSCGRELCCSTWLTDFKKVNTSSARYQQLSINPIKISGQCGKLKCCINFELDSYHDALKSFPNQKKVLKTQKGVAVFIKMDIFKKLLWYSYDFDHFKWYKLSLDHVNEILELNSNNKKSLPLEYYESFFKEDTSNNFENILCKDSLTRFDTLKKVKKTEVVRFKNKTKKLSDNDNTCKSNDQVLLKSKYSLWIKKESNSYIKTPKNKSKQNLINVHKRKNK